MQRLFIALMIPEPQRSQLAWLQAGLEGAHWVQPEKLHLTVRFIGEVPENTVEDIQGLLAGLQVRDFDIHLRGIGVFEPGNRPRSLWAAVADPAPLIALHEKCNQALRRVGVPEERRKYLPHVSLARLVHAHTERLVQYMEAHGGFDAPPFRAEKFSLIRSHLTHHGAAYEILDEFYFLT
jgi:2'-5' RNA ligase